MSDLVAVTGGAGFIGSHLAEGFLRKGYAVRTIDNLTTGSTANLARVKNEIDARKVDIRDLEGLTNAFQDVSIVLHHAGIASVPRSFEDLGFTHDVNVTGTLNVLTAAIRSGVHKVILASSSSVYGNNGVALQIEGSAPSPLSPYALSKWMSELYAAQFAKSTSLETVSFRYFNVFGPRQNVESKYAAVIPLFIRKLTEGGRPVIFGNGRQTRDFTFIDNIVEANLRAAEASLSSGSIMNIATGSRTSLNELVHLLNEIFGSHQEPVYEPARLGDIQDSLADISLSKDLLGDYNLTAFREGLVKTARWFLEISGRISRCE
jgi:nucleoside-diphosphate-sugar epimerase